MRVEDRRERSKKEKAEGRERGKKEKAGGQAKRGGQVKAREEKKESWREEGEHGKRDGEKRVE